ncbi:MAG: HAD family phosphatase [Lachnospiraceae bacterium]|nr:HAD family phosphatase [Lachnospiraceae bacterium]
MIKNIVFDMGNVLTKYSMAEYICRRTDTEEERRIIKNEVCGSVEWIQMDRGILTDEEGIASICKCVPKEYHSLVERFINEFRMEPEPNPPMESLLRWLKDAGYDLYLLSNAAYRFHRFSKNIASISYMKGIWISCEHGDLKPEREAYLSFFEKFDLKPEECLFIDDSAANIEAAMRCGMQGIVFHGDVEELENKIKEQMFA